MNTIKVIADNREYRSGIASLLKSRGVDVEEQRLSVGDYLVDNSWLIERKTLTDLASSIIDGRLFDQCSRLARSPYRSILLLEGSSHELKRRNIRREAIQGALVSVSLFMNVQILRSLSPEESASLLLTIARQQHQLLRFGRKVKQRYPACKGQGKYRKQLQILQSLPGIGAERAQALLQSFGSVEKVLTATEAELSEVDGIGSKTATKMRWVLEEPRGRYGQN